MRILLGIPGGIAAYRAAELARGLTKSGHQVRCVLTEAGARFITPLTLSSLTGQSCYGANPDADQWRAQAVIEHVELANWAEVAAIVPATADFIAKAAHGLADDLLSTILLAARCPIVWAPAMNSVMWKHPAVQQNLERLRRFGHILVDPVSGLLACGMEGMGKLADLEDIAEAIHYASVPRHPAFQGRRILLTGGPTREDLDPVRTLTNRSSGRMGIELARAFRDAGAEVELVLGGDLPGPWQVAVTRVRSAEDMLEACQRLWPECDGFVGAAAVADQKPEAYCREKVKKQQGIEMLPLVRTPDVLATLARTRKDGQWLLGFAAESEKHVDHAMQKLIAKGVDGILANDIQSGQGFGEQNNTLIPVTPHGAEEALGPAPKEQLAKRVVEWWGRKLLEIG